jgi:glycosyltransferase involved in cell wall biosynthesis
MIKKIRVLECIRQGQIGGGESHLLSLVENLDRSVFEPVVLSFTDGPMVDRLQAMSIPCYVIPTTRPFDVGKWNRVKKFIHEQDVDLIHAHGTRANSNLFWAAGKLRIPLIYTVHGWSFHPDQNLITRKIRILGEKYLISKSDIVISVSVSNKESGKKFMKSFDSVVINNGIDPKKFNGGKAHKNIRTELGIDENSLLVVFIARFTSHKQPLSLIRAFAKAIGSNPKLHLLMVGDGDEKVEAEKMIAALGMENRISLQPFRQDVPDILAASDIYVLPSLWEGLPIGLLEAMMMGKAVIASNVDGTSEIIEHNKNGLLVNTDNLVNDLTEKIVSLSLDAGLRKKFQIQAKQTVEQRFNAETMTREIERLYHQVLQNRAD